MTEEERKAIVENGRNVYLADGLRAGFAGWKIEDACGVHSARPGFWACSWETAKAVLARPDRRFNADDQIWKTGDGWFGIYPPAPDEYQTAEDYEKAKAKDFF